MGDGSRQNHQVFVGQQEFKPFEHGIGYPLFRVRVVRLERTGIRNCSSGRLVLRP